MVNFGGRKTARRFWKRRGKGKTQPGKMNAPQANVARLTGGIRKASPATFPPVFRVYNPVAMPARSRYDVLSGGGNQPDTKKGEAKMTKKNFQDFMKDNFALEIYKGLRCAAQNLRTAEKAGNTADIAEWENEWDICNNALMRRGYNTAELALAVHEIG